MNEQEKVVYVSFGKVARDRIGQQCQYAKRYLLVPELVEDIRWRGDINNYHFLEIAKDDVEVFVSRVVAWRRRNGQV